MIFSKMIATCGGIGNVKGGGTIAAIVYTILWLLIRPSINNMPVQVVLFGILVVVGVWVSNKLETVWGKDSSKIVIDEVAGMCCTLLFVPIQWQYALIGLAAFRFFDIVKPFFIASAEKLPGGLGGNGRRCGSRHLCQFAGSAGSGYKFDIGMVTFLKAQAAAITGSAVDGLVFFVMAQLTGKTPDKLSMATAVGAFCGGLVNFIIARKWVFSDGQKGTHVQAGRYILVWAGSIFLNARGVYFVTTYFETINFLVARLLVSILVGITYNYFLQKRFVFK